MKENGMKIKKKDLEYLGIIIVERGMRESGETERRTGMAFITSGMGINLSENGPMARKRALALYILQMEADSRGNGQKIVLMALEY